MNTAVPDDGLWLDEAAGPLVRPYTVTNGRTQPTNNLNMLSLVRATGQVRSERLDADHAQALGYCHGPTSVAEVAAHLRLPVAVTKVLLSDLIDCGAVMTQAQMPVADPTDRYVLEAVLNGLRQRL
jgi:hypothetical protein